MTKSRVAPKPHTNPDTLPAEVAATLAAESLALLDVVRAAEEKHAAAVAAETLANDAAQRLRLAAETAEREYRAAVIAAGDREREWMTEQTDARWSAVAAARALRDQNELRAKGARDAAEGAAADLALAVGRTTEARDAMLAAREEVRQSAAGREREVRRRVALESVRALHLLGQEVGGMGGGMLAHETADNRTGDPLSPYQGGAILRCAYAAAAQCAQAAAYAFGDERREFRRENYDRAVAIGAHAANVAKALE